MSAKNDPATFRNTNARLVNNVFDRMSVGSGSDSPAVESHNLIQSGGAGASLITSDPAFAGSWYELQAKTPAVDTGLPGSAPAVDWADARRDARPDRGAFEFGACAARWEPPCSPRRR